MVAYLQTLVETNGFVLISGNCPLGEHKNSDGCWVDDILTHTIECPSCGQIYTCSIDTYHGVGAFRRDV